MFLSKKIIIVLTLTGSVNAAVLNICTSPKRRATQSCTATDHFFFVSYSVYIGVPMVVQMTAITRTMLSSSINSSL